MDVVGSKTTSGPKFTVALTTADIASLENGQPLEMLDPETKLLFEVKPADAAAYLLEVGPNAFNLLDVMLAGWLYPETVDTWIMTLSRDQGVVRVRKFAVGAKTTAGTTVTATTIEIVGGTPVKK